MAFARWISDKNISLFKSAYNRAGFAKDKVSILHLANDKHLGRVQFIEEKFSGIREYYHPYLLLMTGKFLIPFIH